MERMVRPILLAWTGNSDIRAAREGSDVDRGPVASVAAGVGATRAYVLSDAGEEDQGAFRSHFEAQVPGAGLELMKVDLRGAPTTLRPIYEATRALSLRVAAEHRGAPLVICISSGTPSMMASWLLIAKTELLRENVRLVEGVTPDRSGSGSYLVRDLDVPFDIHATLEREWNERDRRLLEEAVLAVSKPESPFAKILGESQEIVAAKALAHRYAAANAPVLLCGPTGSGKELFAEAIHRASPRVGNAIVTRNCGSFGGDPKLAQSDLFGHTKGAYTGATTERKGAFILAHRGTLFLDEVGELDSETQAQLLRALSAGEIQPVGGEPVKGLDVRVVAATNRDLAEQVRGGSFREDLYYRLFVLVVTVPPLAVRGGDLRILAASIAGEMGATIEEAAVTRLARYPWPGNVRELRNVITGAHAIAGSGRTITREHVEFHMERLGTGRMPQLGALPGAGFDLRGHLEAVERHYYVQALEQTGWNLARAAELLGYTSQNVGQRVRTLGLTRPSRP